MSNTAYFNLAIPAPRRLAMMRADFAAHATKYPHCPEYAKPQSWRNVRHWGLHNWEAAFCTLDQGAEDGTPIWYCHTREYFRDERDAGDIVRRLPSGYYTDTEGNDTAIGIVARLPHGRFLAGYRWTCNDERVYFPKVFDDEDEAATRADGHAEWFADRSREDSERFDAMQRAEIAADDARTELEGLWPGRNSSEYLRDRVRDAIEALREARETLADATREYEKA